MAIVVVAGPGAAKLQTMKTTKPKTMLDHGQVAASGGGVAKNARLEIERKTGLKVISPLNAADAGALDVDEGPSALPEK